VIPTIAVRKSGAESAPLMPCANSFAAVARVRRAAIGRTGVAPSREELAEQLGMSAAKVDLLQTGAFMTRELSLDRPLGTEREQTLHDLLPAAEQLDPVEALDQSTVPCTTARPSHGTYATSTCSDTLRSLLAFYGPNAKGLPSGVSGKHWLLASRAGGRARKVFVHVDGHARAAPRCAQHGPDATGSYRSGSPRTTGTLVAWVVLQEDP
jgi:hypothetical protein